MIEHGMYFATNNLYELIKNNGGEWNDTKERPIVCLMKSTEFTDIYWAIPVGNWNHRNPIAQERINSFLARNNDDIRSCYYHVGNTNVRSIFFISDAIPITEHYIEREYINRYSGNIYTIQNGELISELTRKLSRILAFEKSNPNYFRQHITDTVNALQAEQCS